MARPHPTTFALEVRRRLEFEERYCCWVWSSTFSAAPGLRREPVLRGRLLRPLLGLSAPLCGTRGCLNPAHATKVRPNHCHNGHRRASAVPRDCEQCERRYLSRRRKYRYTTGRELPERRPFLMEDLPARLRPEVWEVTLDSRGISWSSSHGVAGRAEIPAEVRTLLKIDSTGTFRSRAD